MSRHDVRPGEQARRTPGVGAVIKGFFLLIGRLLATMIMVGIITGCIVACVLTVYILQMVGAETAIDLDAVRMGYTSIIYGEDPDTGESVVLKRLYIGGEDRTWVDYYSISDYVKEAIVAVEDKRFWLHDGVDWRRTFGAFIDFFIPLTGTRAGGGSTITQQLIKNITQDNEVRVDRKVREIFRALDMQKRYSREQILEAYLNLVPLGNGTNGIQAAANVYFGKNASELTLAESASIVGITQYPGRYDPFVNPENNKARQEHILDEMLDQERITQKEYDEAIKEPLSFKQKEHFDQISEVSDYFVDHVINEVIEDLMEYKGMTKAYATEQLYQGGFRIYATVDLEMQAYLEEFYLNTDKFPDVTNSTYPQSCCVIIDPGGKMLAVVGGIGEKEGNRVFNRATMALRQPGSAIKPIGAYATAFEYNRITWSTIIDDSPLTGTPNGWSPANYYRGFDGPMTVNMALQRSVNTVAAKVVQSMTPERVFNFMHNELDMYSLVEYEARDNQVFSDVDLAPMSLGALTYGVTPLEMAGAYQIFVNGGLFTSPYSYTRIEDANGRIILEKDTTPRRVLDEDTAVLMNKLLQQVVIGERGTGKNANLGTMPTAGKTGTSQDDVNQWFIGMSPYYIAPVWLGYDKTVRVEVSSSGKRNVVPNSIGYYTYPPPILWKSIMLPLHEELEYQQFLESPNVVSKTYCTMTGDLATIYCTATASGWYKSNRLPGNCTMHTSEPIPDPVFPEYPDDGVSFGDPYANDPDYYYPYSNDPSYNNDYYDDYSNNWPNNN